MPESWVGGVTVILGDKSTTEQTLAFSARALMDKLAVTMVTTDD